MKLFLRFLLLLALGLCSLWGSYYFGIDTPKKLLKWKWATGKVFGYSDRVGSTYKGLRVKFTYDEKQYEVTTKASVSTKDFVMNERVGVVFPEEDPTKAELRSYSRLLVVPLILLLAGLLLCLIGITGIVRKILGKPDPVTVDHRKPTS
ncbi:hypothetical protein WSM22_35590 [Cytophagales bacterium WSM2-2]|nr:hypothetical protein WSM22_35590 [Cytophagales bacterium WSM2-2]